MTALIVGISGVRGIIGENLGPEEAVAFGMAYGSFLREGKGEEDSVRVCIGRDSRVSGSMMAAGLSAGLTATGCHAVDLGVVTTPGAALMVKWLGCDGGVVITASHNPIAWNGIKFLRNDGIAYPAEEVKRIHKNYYEKTFRRADAVHVGKVETDSRTHAVHVDTVKQLCDKNLIASKRFKVVLDSINGAGCVVSANLLSALGCELIHLNGSPTGLFAHTPEPTAENLKDVGPVVVKHRAAVGFAQDPDADRLAVIDEKGTYIGEEYTLALAVKYIFTKKKGAVAANLSTSRMIDDLAAAAGCKVIRTPVGEAHVANAMVANGCILGGEGNGGVIDLRVGPVRNSLVGMAMILQLMAETGKTVSELAAEIPRYAMLKTKFPCEPDKTGAALVKVRAYYEGAAGRGAKVDTQDGIRVDLPAGWVQLRASNTEPIMRIMAECRGQAEAEELVREVQKVIGL